MVLDELEKRAISHSLGAMQQVINRSFASKESSYVGKESDIAWIEAMPQAITRTFALKESSLVSKTQATPARCREGWQTK